MRSLPHESPWRPRAGLLAAAVLFAGACLLACGRASLPAADTGAWNLQQSLESASHVEVTLPVGKVLSWSRAREHVPLGPSGPELAFRGPGDESDPGALRIVVGDATLEEAVALAERIGLEPGEEGGFTLLGRDFPDAGDAVRAVFEDPAHPGRPLTLWFGNDLERLALYTRDARPGWRPEVHAWKQGDLTFHCPLDLDGTPRDDELHDLRPAQEELFGQAVAQTVGSVGFYVVGPVRPKSLKSYVFRVGQVHAQVKRWLAPRATPSLNVFVYGTAEDRARATGWADFADVNPVAPAVHVVLSEGTPHDGGDAVARATALAVAGAPASPWMLDGLAVHVAGAWWQRPLEGWVGTLQNSGRLPAIEEIIDPGASARYSPHILQPARGFLMRTILETRGAQRVEALWNGAVPFQADRLFTQAWRRAVARAAAKSAASPVRKEGGRRAAVVQAPFRHGVALVEQEPADAGTPGYLRQGIVESLGKAREYGADAVSLTVFATNTTYRSPNPFGGQRPVSGSTTDLALLHAVLTASRGGLRTMLVVEPLVAASGSREQGDVTQSEGEWGAFFADFEAVAVHYGLLAELLMVDVLCLGSELRKASWTIPVEEEPDYDASKAKDPEHDDKARRDADRRIFLLESWTVLIEEVREVFSGAVTYAAKDVHEAQRVGFWEELDFIGAHAFPAWHDLEEDSPTDDRIRGAYRKLFVQFSELSRERQRPFLLVQVGFPSAAESWDRSWVPMGPADAATQQRVYHSLIEALDNSGRRYRGFLGYFLWSWSTDAAAGGPDDRGFTPQNKDAEDTLSLLFGTPR